MSALERADRWHTGGDSGRSCDAACARQPSVLQAVVLSTCALLTMSLGACSGGDDAEAAARQSIERIARTLSVSVELADAAGGAPVEQAEGGPWTIEERLEHYGTAGIVLSTARRGRAFAQAAWGGDVEPDLDLPLDQRFALEQSSSLVTALAVLRLIEQGRWTLETDVRELAGVPGVVARHNEPVLLRDLLRQSSGLRPEGPTGVRAQALAEEFRWPPNAVRNWSETGESDWSLLQLLIEAETASSWEESVRQLVLDPLAIAELSIAEGGGAATVQDAAGRRREITYRPLAARGASVSARGAVQLMAAFCGPGREAGPQTMDEPSRRAAEFLSAGLRRTVRREGPGRWGLGLKVEQGGALLSRSSEASLLVCHPSSGDVAVVMTNGGRGLELAREVMLATAREFGWDHVGPEQLEEIAYPAEAAQLVIGSYRFEEPPVQVDLSWTPERLLLEAPPSDLFPGEGPVRTSLIRGRRGLRRLERPDEIALDFDAEANWSLRINGRTGRRVVTEDQLSAAGPATEPGALVPTPTVGSEETIEH